MESLPKADQRDTLPLPADPALRERDERLESMGTLAGKLVHDFNNFMSPLRGYLTLIREEKPSQTITNYVEMMETSSRRVEGVMESALLAVRPQRMFRPEKIDFTALVESTLDHWLKGVPDTAQINLTRELGPFDWDADPRHWREVILQLLNNARFALVTGGNLEVSLRERNLTTQQSADLGLGTQNVFQLVFRDHGFGMPEATLKRACEPFFSTRVKGQALGLGLTIAHSVTRLHGGQLTLESREDAGTTVNLWLPKIRPPRKSPSVSTPARQATIPRAGARKILLVDDDPMVREVIKACLQREKYEVYVAADGAEALKIFEKHQDSMALVLTDIAMPNMNGFELVHRIRKLNSNVVFLLISGDISQSVQTGLSALGDHPPELIKKPFTVRGLVDVVKKHLGD
jgi:two-component system cell cycle sensor histidine kinase/response regulator CckA